VTFTAWKEKWKKKRDEERAKKEKEDKKRGKRVTGRAAFSINPNLFVDAEGAADEVEIEEDKNEEEVAFKEIADAEDEQWLK